MKKLKPTVTSEREVAELVVVEDHTSSKRRERLSYFLATQNGNLSCWDDSSKVSVALIDKTSLKSETSDHLLDKELNDVAKEILGSVKTSVLKRHLPAKKSVSVKTFNEKRRCVRQNDSKVEVDVFPETVEGTNVSRISVNKMSVNDASTQTTSSDMNDFDSFESAGPDIEESGELSRSNSLQWKRQILKRSTTAKQVQNRDDLPRERLVTQPNVKAGTNGSEISSQHEGQTDKKCEDKIAGSEASDSVIYSRNGPRPKQRKNILKMLFSCWTWRKPKRRR